jgi:hypothetical protein
MLTASNALVRQHLQKVELAGVLMRIGSFSLVSWMGPASPFMLVWSVNTFDAVLLTWCALLRRQSSYILLNAFWILVGIVGILRAGAWLP